MKAAILLLTDDRPVRAAEFHKQAISFVKSIGQDPVSIDACARLTDITRTAHSFGDGYLSQLAVFGHGTPTALMRPGRWGIDTRPRRWKTGNFIAPDFFASVWAPKLAPGALISLAACLCSRDPKWYRVERWGTDVSPWSAASYADGGLKSIAAVLARAFSSEGVEGVRVRGHCAAGHCTSQALLREHRAGDEAGLGRSLFGKVLPGVKPTRKLMRAWQRTVKGRLARAYLLGLHPDDELIPEIAQRMSA